MSAAVRALWTKAEIAEAHDLATTCEASSNRWAFADWLLAKIPMVPMGAPNAGSGVSLRVTALAVELDLRPGALIELRRTAHSWPAKYRVPYASFSAHERYVRGGPAKAAERSVRLRNAPRDRFGKTRTMRAPCDQKPPSPSVHIRRDTYRTLKAEAKHNRTSLAALVDELLQEALGARAWLAEEVA